MAVDSIFLASFCLNIQSPPSACFLIGLLISIYLSNTPLCSVRSLSSRAHSPSNTHFRILRGLESTRAEALCLISRISWRGISRELNCNACRLGLSWSWYLSALLPIRCIAQKKAHCCGYRICAKLLSASPHLLSGSLGPCGADDDGCSACLSRQGRNRTRDPPPSSCFLRGI